MLLLTAKQNDIIHCDQELLKIVSVNPDTNITVIEYMGQKYKLKSGVLYTLQPEKGFVFVVRNINKRGYIKLGMDGQVTFLRDKVFQRQK